MKNQKLIIIGITTLVVLGISFFLIKPVVTSVWISLKNYSQAKSELKALNEKKQILAELQENPNLKNVSEIAQNYIPKDTESGQLVIELTAMARANNLKVEQISLEKSKTSTSTTEEATPTPAAKTNASPTPTPSGSANPTGDAKPVDFSLQVSGSFNDFLNFLNTVETSSRLISLKNITMQQKVGTDKSVTFSAQISGSAFYKNKITVESTNDNLKISDDIINKFLNLKAYGQPIDLPTESGFGRSNPFEGY